MNELTMRDYLKVLFRQKWVIIACIVTVTLTVAIGLKFQTKQYAASVKLLISSQKQSGSPYYRDIQDIQNSQLVMTESEIVTSMPVLDRALRAILVYKPLSSFVGYEGNFASPLKRILIDRQVKKFHEEFDSSKLTAAQKDLYLYRIALDNLRANVKVNSMPDTNIFTITVTDYDPMMAAVIANIVSRSYIIFDLEQQLAEMQQKYGEKNQAISQLRDDIQIMTNNLTGQPLDNVDAIGPASVKIIEQAYPPSGPIGRGKMTIFILGFVMSLILGVILAFIFDYLDQTFRSPDEIEGFLNIPYLGGVPVSNDLIAFKSVAEQIYLLMKDKSLKTILFFAAHKGEGVSTVVRQVGQYISSSMGHRVLIIEANPGQNAKNKGGKIVPGLFDILEEKADLAQSIQKNGEKLHLLPAGQATLNPCLLLGSQHMANIIKYAREKYEIVLIDVDALSVSKDALELSNALEAVVLIVAEGKTRRQAIKYALENFRKRKAVILGAILNKRQFSIPKFLYERV